MDIRRLIRLGLLGLVAIAGCRDRLLVEEMGESAAAYRPRSVAARRAAARPARPQPAGAVQAQPAPAGQPTAAPAMPEGGDIHLLYIVQAGTAVPSGPYIHTVITGQRQPGQVAWLVNWLTEPTGYGGTPQQPFLIYTDAAVTEWAAQIAGAIDAPSRNGGWNAARDALLAFGAPQEIDRAAGQRVAEALEPICSGGDPEYRWTACMLAGRLAGEVLGEWARAAELFARAASISPAASPAWLVASYGRASALLESGDRGQAREVAQQIVQQSQQRYSRVRAYRQAQRIAEQGG